MTGNQLVDREPKELLDFLHIAEKLKCNTRHSYTSSWRHESVAEHSWRLALIAFLMKDQIPGVDMDKVLRMCLIHDLGEAITGDIPSFEKSDANERTEAKAIDGLVASLPQPLSGELAALFAEMEARETPEAKVFKALDRMEAVLQHNEAPLETWIPLEYELTRTYGTEDAAPYPFLKALREQMCRDTEEKISGNMS